MKRDLVFFGMQGSWKWTQAKKLIELYPEEYAYFSSWEVFRALTQTENAIWDYVKDTIEKWHLVNDDVTINIFHTYFITLKDTKKSMLLDGYPRNKKQVDDLFEHAQGNDRKLFGIYFELWEEEAIKRMFDRWRKDDNKEAIKKRLKAYKEKTEPVIKYFDQKGLLIKINANQPIEEVFSDLSKIIILDRR